MRQIGSRSQGFTLIELIIVIIVLSILAVTAAPRFLDFTRSARISTLEGMAGVLQSSVSLVRARAAIDGKLSGSHSVLVGGANIDTYDGYPVALWYTSLRYLINDDDADFTSSNVVCEVDWCGFGGSTNINGAPTITGNGGKLWPKGSDGNLCFVYYINNEDGTAPLIGTATDNC